MKKIDITGKKFGRLTALYENGRRGKNILWRCKCICYRSDDWLIGVLSMVAEPTLIYQKIKSQKSCESLPTTIHKLNFFDYDKRTNG